MDFEIDIEPEPAYERAEDIRDDYDVEKFKRSGGLDTQHSCNNNINQEDYSMYIINKEAHHELTTYNPRFKRANEEHQKPEPSEMETQVKRRKKKKKKKKVLQPEEEQDNLEKYNSPDKSLAQAQEDQFEQRYEAEVTLEEQKHVEAGFSTIQEEPNASSVDFSREIIETPDKVEEVKVKNLTYGSKEIPYHANKEGGRLMTNIPRAVKDTSQDDLSKDPSQFLGSHRLSADLKHLRNHAGIEEFKEYRDISPEEIHNLTLLTLPQKKTTSHACFYGTYCGRKVFLKEYNVSDTDMKKKCIAELMFYSQNPHIGLVNQLGVYLELYPLVYIVYEYYTTITLGDLMREGKLAEINEKSKSQLIVQILHSLEFLEKAQSRTTDEQVITYKLACIDPDNILVVKAPISLECKLCGFSDIIEVGQDESFPIDIPESLFNYLPKLRLFSPECILSRKLSESSLGYSAGVMMISIFTEERFLPKISDLEYVNLLVTKPSEIWDTETGDLEISSFLSKIPYKTLIQRCCTFEEAKRLTISRLIEFLMKKLF
ncbi:unnamed protein product [Moneuplotes crassus]|uniref:Protein kinase domain-containing protein n=1 Tax=Euplotes crassus TaxID=5936 RepID=A0AAD1UA47_EUPCR|nr:unnamed protein product [Moneuplotes crassus]